MSKILSICIPTYNMEKYLDVNLKEIVRLADKLDLNYKIEVCVSDNNSSDNTEKVVNKYVDSNLNIKYHKNINNIGADRNFLKSVEISNGKYAWILGADDILLEQALIKIFEWIESDKYDILLGDRLNIDLLGKEKNIQHWAIEKAIVSNKNYSPFIDNSYKLGAVFSYISSIIFKKKKWDIEKEKLDLEQFIGTCYIHSLILVSMIKNNSTMFYTHEAFVKNRVGNDSFLNEGYFNRMKIDFNYLEIFEYLFSKNSNEYKSVRLLLNRERTFLHFLKAKYLVSNNLNIKKDFDTFLDKMNINNGTIIRNTPNLLIKLLLNLYKKRLVFDEKSINP